MGKVARIKIERRRDGIYVIAEKRNARGVHYRVEQVYVNRRGETRAEFREARKEAILRMMAV